MNKNLKALLLAILLIAGLLNTEAHAGAIHTVEKHPFLSALGFGGALYMNSIMHKARNLSYHLDKVDPFFEAHPADFDKISAYVLKALAHPANEQDYDRYKKLAEIMRLDNIPPYEKTDSPNPNIIVSPQGERIDASTEFPIETPKTWEEYLIAKSNSKELADNMEADGLGKKPPGYAAHHVVPATDPEAEKARDVLVGHSIEINGSENGVYLPTPKDQAATHGIEHNGRHPKDYGTQVNDLIVNADARGGKQEVINTLNRIKENLSKAPRPSKWVDVLKDIQ